jgi:hypothetical protein
VPYSNSTHAKIASGQTASSEVDLRGVRLLGISTPAAFTGTTLSFQVAEVPTANGGVYQNVFHLNTLAATAFTITGVAASQHIVIDGSLLPEGFGNCMLKVVSGSAEGADRDLILFTTPA